MGKYKTFSTKGVLFLYLEKNFGIKIDKIHPTGKIFTTDKNISDLRICQEMYLTSTQNNTAFMFAITEYNGKIYGAIHGKKFKYIENELEEC